LPLPSYIRSDGTEMVPADLMMLCERAGGVESLGQWFAGHWEDSDRAAAEWESYLDGQYVCLRSVTPENIQRKDYLVDAINREVADPRPQSRQWLADLHDLVDELDAIEPPFAPYDRLRFGRPISRDTAIDAVRSRFPLPSGGSAGGSAQGSDQGDRGGGQLYGDGNGEHRPEMAGSAKHGTADQGGKR
jgi:hypothetical protein